jgi:hypothetical protein
MPYGMFINRLVSFRCKYNKLTVLMLDNLSYEWDTEIDEWNIASEKKDYPRYGCYQILREFCSADDGTNGL